MDIVKSSAGQGRLQARSGRYKLPALQILMLQRYPADCSRSERDLTSSHSESNVQYDEAVGLLHEPWLSIEESERRLRRP